MTRAHSRAVERGMAVSVFTSELFGAGNEGDNHAAVWAVPWEELDLVGLDVHGPRNAVDKVARGARIHP
nr:DUF2000 family protein [Actinopolyspora mortivallis]